MFQSLATLRARVPGQASIRRALAGRARRVLRLGAADALSVNEIACPDPGCPDVATVILLMPDGRPTRAIRIAKPVAAVTDADITAAERKGLAEGP